MLTAKISLLLCFFAHEFKLTNQLQSWWISDTEIAYDIPGEALGVYDSLTRNFTKASRHFPNVSGVAHSHDLKYTAMYIVPDDAYRSPDKVTFSVIIHDISKSTNYTVGVYSTDKASSHYEFVLLSAHCQIESFVWSHGSAYAFQEEDHLYFVPSPEKSPIRITTDNVTVTHSLFSGAFRYDNQLHLNKEGDYNMFSASDKYLAYFSTPKNQSKKVIMTTYTKGNAYDHHYEMDYSSFGAKSLPFYNISIWSVADKEAMVVDIARKNISSFQHYMGASWVVLHGKECLVTAWTNRYVNHTTVLLCSYESRNCTQNYEHKYEYSQWADGGDYEMNAYSDSSIFVLLPHQTGNNSWQHIAKIDITPYLHFESITWIPSGEYDVSRILAYRKDEDVLIYEAQAPHPWNRHVYGAPTGEWSVLTEDRCLTCFSSECTYQKQTSVSPGDDLLIEFFCSGTSPQYHVLTTFNDTLDLVEIQNITEPAPQSVRREWKTEIFTLQNDYEAIVQIYEGNNSLASMPVILDVYGGPNENKVTDSYDENPWPIGYGSSAIVRIDVRGSGGRGWNYRSPIYGGLVTVEVEDTLEAMKMVLEKYPRLDKNRVTVFGWSYGGTLAAALVEIAPQSFFKCAISGAPVTNFFDYNAPYTENYMGDAPRSSFTDLTANVTAFEHTKLLLIHGLRDDRVLFHHSALLIEALQEANIQFDLMVYPNQDHWIRGNASYHVARIMKTFLQTCFDHKEEKEFV